MLFHCNVELAEPVERSPAGVPNAWRLFAVGANPLTIRGEEAVLNLGREEMRRIVEYHQKKGCRIPIDSRHFISQLATSLQRDESEILNLLPHGTATMGFGSLELREDGLWITDVEFVPLAEDLLKAGTVKYCSPVIRGMDGSEPLRLTSVALDNEPCMNQLPELTTALSLAELNILFDKLKTEEAAMPNEPNLEALRDKVVREVLELSENDNPETVRGKLIAIKTQAELVPGLNKRVRELELAEEERKCRELIAEMLEKGQLSNAQAESGHFRSMSYAELSEYRNATPEGTMVNTKKIFSAQKRGMDAVSESKIWKNLGLSRNA